MPATAQAFLWLFRQPELLDTCARRFGPLFTLQLAQQGTFVCIGDCGLVRQVFTADTDRLRAGAFNAIMEPLPGSGSLLLLDGTDHLRERRLILPPLHGSRVATYAEAARSAAHADIDRWPLGTPFRLHERMQRIAFDVLLRAVLGIEDETVFARMLDLFPALFARAGPIMMIQALQRDFGPLSPWRRFVRLRDEVDDLVYDQIRARRSDPRLAERDDVLSLLLVARDEQGNGLSDRHLRDELVTFLIAGHETTATGLAWAADLLLRNPWVLERLRGEIAQGDDTYLEAVGKETLRIRPVIANVGRRVQEPVEFAGHPVAAGVSLIPAIYLVHRDPDLFPQPEAFRPERFLDRGSLGYSWIPFGGGTRRCPGAAFAALEMREVLRVVLERTSLRLADARPQRAVRRGVTLVPNRGTPVVVDSKA